MPALPLIRVGYAADMADNGQSSRGGLSTLHCAKCDYNVTGLSSGVCPSCGTRFAPEEALPPRQLDQPGFLRAMVMLYLMTGPGAMLLVKLPWAVMMMGALAIVAQPTTVLFLGLAWGLRITAGKPERPGKPAKPAKRKLVRAAACVGVMVLLALASLAEWHLVMSWVQWPTRR